MARYGKVVPRGHSVALSVRDLNFERSQVFLEAFSPSFVKAARFGRPQPYNFFQTSPLLLVWKAIITHRDKRPANNSWRTLMMVSILWHALDSRAAALDSRWSQSPFFPKAKAIK